MDASSALAHNPFAAPARDEMTRSQRELAHDAILCREENLRLESTIRSLGYVLYVAAGYGAVFSAVFALITGAMALYGPDRGIGLLALVVATAGLGACTLLTWSAGRGLLRLEPRGRSRAALPLLLLTGASFGMGALFFQILHGRSADYIFSEHYRRICDDTPHIEPSTPGFIKALIGVFGAGPVIITLIGVLLGP